MSIVHLKNFQITHLLFALSQFLHSSSRDSGCGRATPFDDCFLRLERIDLDLMVGSKIILAVVATVILCQTAALGCTCVELPKNSTAFRKAKAVFVGEVVYAAEHSHSPERWGDDHVPFIRIVTFKIEKSWKGARRSEVEVWVDVGFSNCSSYRFREGEKYLVYAREYKGSLVLYWCSHSALAISFPSEEASKHIRQLNILR